MRTYLKSLSVTILIVGLLLVVCGVAFGAPTSTIVQNLVINSLKDGTNPCLNIGSTGLVATSTCGGGGGGSGTVSTSSALTAGQWVIAGGYNSVYSTSSQPILTVNASGTLIQIGSVSATGTISIGVSQKLSNYTNDAGFITSAVLSIDSLTGAVNIATGTLGTDFNVVSSSGALTFNCPSSSATNRGCLTSADWGTFNSKASTTATVSAGTGLTGGGTIGSNPTINLSVPVSVANGGRATTTAPTDSQIDSANGANPAWKSLIGGTNVTISTSTTSITINSTASGGGAAVNQYSCTFDFSNATLPNSNFALTKRTNGTNVNYNYLDYPSATSSQAEWNCPISGALAFNTSTLKIFYSSTSTTQNGSSSAWQAFYNSYSSSSPALDTAYLSQVNATSTMGTSTLSFYVATLNFPSSTVASSGVDSYLMVKIKRLGSGGDTFGGSQQLLKAVLNFF